MEVVVDTKSGFCFGVKNVIALAEAEINQGKSFYCLGDIVHNEQEVLRLENLGMKTIDYTMFNTLKNCKVLIRAHGEPPETYEYARLNNIELIEGTCPVVLKIQQKIRKKNEGLKGNGTIVLFGKPQHPEVIGLNGQVSNAAIIVQKIEDLDKIDFSKKVILFSQTTMSRENYNELKNEAIKRIKSVELLESCDTICGQVSNRGPWLEEFSQNVDAVVFVGGKKSSNSKVLFNHCLNVNRNSFFITSADEISVLNLSSFDKIGVCGATSTPQWLMDEVALQLRKLP